MAGFSVNIGANIAPLTAGLNQATADVQKFGNELAAVPTQALSTLNTVVQTTVAHFDELAASSAALAKINASIYAAADSALQAGPKFDSLGGRLPLQDFNEFKKTIDVFKRDISTGFKFSFPPTPIPPALPEAFNKTKAGANQAAAALTNIGRVAQDLPFGFVGIQNNLNPLLESFQRLKAETGSGKAALASLGQSLIGAGGIGLALSVVSSALLIFQNGIAGFNSKTKEAKEKADEFAKSIRSIGLVQQEATAGVEGQISQVTALAAAVNDSNVPYAQRKRALEELKDINKAYFGDLKLEDAATGALTKTVDEYTKALINNAIQKGFVDEIASVAKAVAKQDDVIRTSKLKLAQAQKAVADAENFLPSGTRDIETARAQNRQNAVQKEKEALENLRTENGKVTQLLTQEALIREQLNKAVLEGTKFKDLDTKNDKKEEDALKKRLEALEKIKAATKDATALVGLQESIFELQVKIAVRDQGKNRLTKSELDQQIKGFQDELNEAFKKQAIELELSPKVKLSPVTKLDINEIVNKAFTTKDSLRVVIGNNGISLVVAKEAVDVTDLQGKIAKATGLDKKIPIITLHEVRIKILGVKLTEKIEFQEKILKELNDSFNQIFSNLKIDAVSGLAESIGDAIAGGDIQNVFKSLFSVIATGLQQFGKALIAYGVAQQAFKVATKSLNPTLAIAAGAGLIIAGAALKASLPKFAQGGIVTGPVIGQVGEMHRPEVIMPLDRLPQMLRSIGGGGGNDWQLIPIINNEGLFLAAQKGARRTGRKF